MSALPENEDAPAATPTDAEAEHDTRHLHAVRTGERQDEVVDADIVTDTAPVADTGTDGWVAWAKTALTPESGLYTDRQPAPQEVMRRARYGQQLPEAGPLRAASIGYGYVAAAGQIVCRTVEWALFTNAARALAALIVLSLTGLALLLALT